MRDADAEGFSVAGGGSPVMTPATPVYREHGNAYNIFILVLTIFSLALMVLLLLPIDPETRILVNFYDNMICVIFLVDFAMNLIGSKPKRAYFVSRRGWVDPPRASPSFRVFPTTPLFPLP